MTNNTDRDVAFESKLDPFFSAESQAHLLRITADMDAGRNVVERDLIEVD